DWSKINEDIEVIKVTNLPPLSNEIKNVKLLNIKSNTTGLGISTYDPANPKNNSAPITLVDDEQRIMQNGEHVASIFNLIASISENGASGSGMYLVSEYGDIYLIGICSGAAPENNRIATVVVFTDNNLNWVNDTMKKNSQ
ncbi:MAG: hypothetical protein NTW04_03145, partial [Elusimicrobia bacterium]|nr:hypothetical protein [Elusimicrobiota bacterium]